MATQEPELSQMLSLLSHELRSPLGVVRGYLRLLNQHHSELSEHHRQAVAAALKASDRCVDLLAQATALAQMWRNDTPIKREPVALSEIAQPLEQTIRATGDRPLPVEVDLPADATLRGDRPLLSAAFSSLVSAVHRAQPDDIIVQVSPRLASSGGRDGVAIQIAPRGLSLDAASEMPLDLQRGGLGLGLPMAAAIVEAHAGAISERRVDGRMAVVVWLPLANEERRTKNEEPEPGT